MPIIKAYTLPHPPLAIPAIGRGQESGISKTVAAFEEVAADIAAIKPETIVYITPHSTMYADHFHISPGNEATGDFARFGVSSVKLQTPYDKALAEQITRIAFNHGISAGTEGEKDAALDHGVMVPMWYINKHYTDYKSLRISQSGMSSAEHYILGQIILKAAEALDRKVVVIGSSDLSHRLKSDGPYGYAPEGEEFDNAVTEALSKGDFMALMNIPEKIRDGAGECGYNSLMVLAGLFDRKRVIARLLSYEAPYGVGYAVAEFTATGSDDSNNVLEKHLDLMTEESKNAQNAEDDYQKLARGSLEHYIKTSTRLRIPKGLPQEMYSQRAGVFVSLHKRGRLRGCIGTIAPTTESIAEEIIQNAISAGVSDNRFPNVTADELQYITYKVDVLSPSEKIQSPAELDVKRYGVIVTSGMKRGLLLPNLDGVDTVEAQIEIARQKAGISENEKIQLERFEVIRHE